MKKKVMSIVAAVLVISMTVCACGKKEEHTTFTGETTEEPAYQDNLNAISPSAYNDVQGLDLEPGTYISIIGKDSSSSYWKMIKAGVMQAASDLNKELGYTGSDKIKVTYNAPDKSEDIDEQVNILDEELARYPDVIGIASIDADACTVQFDLATENGIPIISLDSGNTYQGIQCRVSTDNVDAARTGAYKLADEINKSGEVLLLIHDSESETAKLREQSLVSEIETNYPDVKVAEKIYCDKLDELKKQIVEEQNQEITEEENQEITEEENQEITEEKNQEITEEENQDSKEEENQDSKEEEKKITVESLTDEDVILYYLEKHPDIKGVFGTNNAATQLGLRVLQEYESEEQIVLMGFDAGADQLKALKSGEISGLVVQNPFGIGYAAVVAAARTVLQIGNEAKVNTGYIWVTKENMESDSIKKMLYE